MSETGTMRVHRLVGGEKIFSSEWAHDKLHNLKIGNYPEAPLGFTQQGQITVMATMSGPLDLKKKKKSLTKSQIKFLTRSTTQSMTLLQSKLVRQLYS